MFLSRGKFYRLSSSGQVQFTLNLLLFFLWQSILGAAFFHCPPSPALEISRLGGPGSGLNPVLPLCGQHGSNETFRPRRWASGTQAFFLRTLWVLWLKDTPKVGPWRWGSEIGDWNW